MAAARKATAKKAEPKQDESAAEIAEAVNAASEVGYIGVKPEPSAPITDSNTPITQHTFTKEASDG